MLSTLAAELEATDRVIEIDNVDENHLAVDKAGRCAAAAHRSMIELADQVRILFGGYT